MKILIAMDSFKGSMSSLDLNNLISDHFSHMNHHVITLPISDGGEGFIDAIHAHCIKPLSFFVGVDPLMKSIRVPYLLIDDTAYLELHATSGITLIPKELHNPLQTTTYGLGLLIKEVISKGAKRIVIGLGGSATNDGGAGMLQALGAKFYSKDGIIESSMNGHLIGQITSVDLSLFNQSIQGVEFIIASDVTNPLCGPQGASHIFARQKGASTKQIHQLESNMIHYAKLMEQTFSKSYQNLPGAGAAGGVGFAALSALHATLYSGIDFMIHLLGAEEHIKSSDLIIVGEGKLDLQTSFGKAPYGLARLAKKYNKKVIGLFGQATHKKQHTYLDVIYAVVPTYATLEESLRSPKTTFKKMLNDVKIS